MSKNHPERDFAAQASGNADLKKFSDDDLARELKLRKKFLRDTEIERRRKISELLYKHKDVLLLFCEHNRLSCSDKNPCNASEQCPRCLFLTEEAHTSFVPRLVFERTGLPEDE